MQRGRTKETERNFPPPKKKFLYSYCVEKITVSAHKDGEINIQNVGFLSSSVNLGSLQTMGERARVK
jgi:hypothetical protein